ncbi:MAG: alpha-1,2-fucosyltransferase [Gemmatimonadetes bacterium]|nr:alpha-1,2-fucosyltransferase [Gemmatimonadota bacterium]
MLETVSDFEVDWRYARTYALDPLRVVAREATASERMEPFGRSRRLWARRWARVKPWGARDYVVEAQRGWDPRIAALPVHGRLTLDGYWQSYRYFEAIADAIRAEIDWQAAAHRGIWGDPRVAPVAPNVLEASVAVHVRWFDRVNVTSPENLSPDYYDHAIALMEERAPGSRYVVFSDDIETTRRVLTALPADRTVFTRGETADPTGLADLMAMRRCRHAAATRLSRTAPSVGGGPGSAGGRGRSSQHRRRNGSRQTVSGLSLRCCRQSGFYFEDDKVQAHVCRHVGAIG